MLAPGFSCLLVAARTVAGSALWTAIFFLSGATRDGHLLRLSATRAADGGRSHSWQWLGDLFLLFPLPYYLHIHILIYGVYALRKALTIPATELPTLQFSYFPILLSTCFRPTYLPTYLPCYL